MQKKGRILLIEDEEDIANLIEIQSEISGFKLVRERNGEEGLKRAEKEKPDLIILDIGLEGVNGLEICRRLKSNAVLKNIPIIFVTAKSSEMDVMLGLEIGADDYVTKPFSPQVLFSRVKAVLRRGKRDDKSNKVVSFGNYLLDIEKYQLKHNEQVISITLSEFSILKKLITNRGMVLTRNQLIGEIQSEGESIVDRNIDVHVASLRKKLGNEFDFIETVRGVGYRFREEEPATV